ncbi:hypothetical protein EMIHUDRAFT_193872 [Emiliania huxleyi CCMP1516]|uniref:Fe2OG dioxygenase domain-containing protein n=2 Tax=Emiliania huxleyi TaxID=2903 RepID=A0A0D3L0J8_EMIH1|nr:hypothetical protein EMIHUDRAFT_193872 [Emiliania huxleyi CCMP1516]EOD41533.1 hypothetical protein EMIHUDRAFT_193872 [Emiliania huxleyi CCMP1516]|eukprot:XP_005793962.1 hypothetical protein EMIHUDRAFT_193872 [Emiliania huxleyi CCMP1516]
MPKRPPATTATCSPKKGKTAVVNPLRDEDKLKFAMKSAAEHFWQRKEPFTCVQWGQQVYAELGYHDFAVNDAGSRIKLNGKLREEAFDSAGSEAAKWLRRNRVKRDADKIGALPALPGPVPQSAEVPVPTQQALQAQAQAQLEAVDVSALYESGALLIPKLLTQQQARECLGALSNEEALEKRETHLRRSTGNGAAGSYFTIRQGQEPPALQAIIEALRDWPALEPSPTPAQRDSLLLRYGCGGINFAHQDQGDFAWQAVLLLNPPSEFEGGALYVTDVNESPLSRREVPFECEGDVIVFAANSTAPLKKKGRNMYHGMTEVTRGQRFAIGMFQGAG